MSEGREKAAYIYIVFRDLRLVGPKFTYQLVLPGVQMFYVAHTGDLSLQLFN